MTDDTKTDVFRATCPNDCIPPFETECVFPGPCPECEVPLHAQILTYAVHDDTDGVVMYCATWSEAMDSAERCAREDAGNPGDAFDAVDSRTGSRFRFQWLTTGTQ